MFLNSLFKNNKVSFVLVRSASTKSGYHSIADFYAGRSVFLTGGTGFLGKVLLERLLYNCSSIDQIYLLIRNKGSVNTDDRLRNILEEPFKRVQFPVALCYAMTINKAQGQTLGVAGVDLSIFQKLRDTRPNDFKKIVPIRGDLSQSNLGITAIDEQRIIENVSVVFHSAGDVKFSNTFKDLFETNAEGTRRILNFAKKIENLHAYIHVSSTYSQTDKNVVQEKIYPIPMDFKEIHAKADLYDADPIKHNYLLHGRTNKYCFSKACAEHVVAHERENLPVILVRPSIITPVYKDPLSGWLDNWFGVTGLIFGLSKGLSHVFTSKKNYIADLIPVDYVANSMVVAAARYEKENGLYVYNACSSYSSPITWKQFVDYSISGSKKSGNSVMPCGVIWTNSQLMVKLIYMFVEIPGAYLADCLQSLKNKERQYLKLQKYINLQRPYIHPFTNNSWIFKSSNLEELHSTLSPEEKSNLGFNPKDIDWKQHCSDYMQGVNRFLFGNKTERN